MRNKSSLKMEGTLKKWLFFFLLSGVFLSFALPAFAAHPLITDDTGTQGKGNWQLEMNAEFASDDEDSERMDALGLNPAIISYGVTDTADLVLSIPYIFVWTKEGGVEKEEHGLSDIVLELKWRFFEKEGLSFALKPGITFPTGDEDKGLGAGKTAYSFFFISTKEFEKTAFHFNLGYHRNENALGERRDLWHASLAAERSVAEKLKLVGNIGIDSDPEGSGDHPVFAIAGVIYSPSEKLDLDAGIKAGLTRSADDFAFLAGLTRRF
jgi:hypothetical protein